MLTRLPTGCAETSALPFLDDPSGPPAMDSLHQRCLFLLTRSQRTPETSVPECAHHHRILDTWGQLLLLLWLLVLLYVIGLW